ncbi:MAG: glycosyltransferase family 39 protein, partial [Planctomycetota bacterium]|nr:glycosyltransferase family 39 protein [Planctomycetota bacterium]
MMPKDRPRTLTLAGLVVLFVLPLFLRLAAVDHGLPRNYVPDTHAVRAALGMARDRDPIPPVARYSTYPNLMPYMLVGVFGAHFAFGCVDGSWSGAEEFAEHVLAEPAGVHLLARLLVALFGALTPWIVLRVAREVGLKRGAWVAAWLVGVGVLHVHFSVQERPWIPLVFFMALALWPASAYQRTPRVRTLGACGAACGLAFATHQAGLATLGIGAFAWLAAPVGWRARDLGRRASHGLACVTAFGLVALLLGHPYLLVHGSTPSAGVVGGAASDFSVGGQGILLAFRWESVGRQLAAAFGYDPALWILAAAGVVGALRSPGARPCALFGLAWAGFFMSLENDHVRYLLPLAVLLAIPAGFAAERLAGGGRGARLALLVLLASPLVASLRLVHVLGSEDTRAEAERTLAQSLPAGALLAVDRYGPTADLNLASLDRLASWRELTTREAHRRTRLAA